MMRWIAALLVATLQTVLTPSFRTQMDSSAACTVRPGMATSPGYLSEGAATPLGAMGMNQVSGTGAGTTEPIVEGPAGAPRTRALSGSAFRPPSPSPASIPRVPEGCLADCPRADAPDCR